jgi:drug/metabolite transporter (DMT)-like permease
MENKNTSVFYNGLVWGLILGFASVIYNVILYMLDQNLNQALGYAGLIITIVVLILGIRSFRDNVRDGVLPFGPAFSFGFIVILVSSVIGIIYGYLLWTVIDPDVLSKMNDLQMEKMMERGIPEEGLDQAMNMASKFMKPGIMAIMGLLGALLMGTIIALIIAAIFKKDAPEDQVITE